MQDPTTRNVHRSITRVDYSFTKNCEKKPTSPWRLNEGLLIMTLPISMPTTMFSMDYANWGH
jgi:hypothetical protein